MSTVVSPAIPMSSGRSETSSGSAGFVMVDWGENGRPDLLGKSFKDLMALGREHVQGGRFAAALAVFKQALKRKPNNPLCHSFLGLCHAQLDPCSVEALPLCKRAAQEMRHPEVLLNLARVYLIMENRRKAVGVLQEASVIAPVYPPLQAELKRVRMRKPPVLRFLSRNNVLNVKLGKLFSRMGLR